MPHWLQLIQHWLLYATRVAVNITLIAIHTKLAIIGHRLLFYFELWSIRTSIISARTTLDAFIPRGFLIIPH
jgi:hypothetical protein